MVGGVVVCVGGCGGGGGQKKTLKMKLHLLLQPVLGTLPEHVHQIIVT